MQRALVLPWTSSISLTRRRRNLPSLSVRAFSSSVSTDQSRGGLPRFYSHILPSSKVSRLSLLPSLVLLSPISVSWRILHSCIQFDIFALITFNQWQGDAIRIQGDEFWHMAKVLRLRVNDRCVSLNVLTEVGPADGSALVFSFPLLSFSFCASSNPTTDYFD